MAQKKKQQFLPRIRVIHVVTLILFVFLLLVVPSLQKNEQPPEQIVTEKKPSASEQVGKMAEPEPALYPQKIANAQEPPYTSARAAIAIDLDSSVVLYGKDEHLPLWPASTTKLMTALVSLDEYNLDDVVTVSNPIQTGSTMGLTEGEQISVENLLYGMLIQSANDAAYALARYHRGGITAFLTLMNDKAKQIHLENTHFFDPAGFDNDKQYTTASDLARLSQMALREKLIARIVSIPNITIADDTFTHFHALKNVNQLLGTMPGVAGVKTGYTENAKENLVNLTKRDGHQILTVVLGSNDRFGDTRALTNWAFANFEWEDFRTH